MQTICYCGALRRVTRRVTARYDAALQPAGINLAQFSLLRNIERHGAVSLTRLGRATELDRSTIGRNIKVLERMGLLQSDAGEDQRETSVSLTRKGRGVLATAEPLWEEAQAAIAKSLGANGVAHLKAIIGAL